MFPDPSSLKTWTDPHGRLWQRIGGHTRGLDEKRTRTLLRRRGVSLATLWAGDVEWFDDPEQKQSAADRLYAAAAHPDDVVGSEWKAEDGTRMLLLEHYC